MQMSLGMTVVVGGGELLRVHTHVTRRPSFSG